MSDVWAGLYGSSAVIADCTGKNPNVFYEMGVTHTVGKPLILISENPEDVPSDLRHVRYITFQFTPRGMQLFEQQLRDTSSHALAYE